jgi:UDP-N-acetylmuramyl pentapeptide phosphotransferase/UDP-N-acetylglucosamine-1-phosphate transferase
MLGDAGANALGGALGLGVVMAGSGTTRLVVLAMLVAVNLASEVVSFSRVIDAVPPLRLLDRAGRRHP